MNRVRLRQILPALALGALLTAPCAWAVPRERMAGTVRAGGAWSVDWDLLSPLWSRVVRWAGKNGLSIDPNGFVPPGTKNGPSIDPDGHTATSPGSPPGASSLQGSSCTPGSGGCGS